MENGAPQTPTSTEAAPPVTGGAIASSANAAEAIPVTAAEAATTTPAFVPATTTEPAADTPPTPATRQRLSADDDAIPDDDVFEVSKSAFKKRLERYSRSQLKQLFGTDSPEEILQWKTQNEEYQRRQEEQRLAEMSEAERYKVQLEKAQAREAQWKQKYEAHVEQNTIREQDRQMTAVAQKYVNPKCMNFLMMEFATHLQGADEKEIGEPQAYADQWFKNYIEANPEFGVAQPAAPVASNEVAAAAAVDVNGTPAAQAPAPPAPRQVQQTITNGPTIGRPTNAVPAGVMAQKTLAPGQPNSMSPEEAKRWMREHGYNY